MAKTKPSPVPAGYQTLTANLVFKDCSAALKFYEKAFGIKIETIMKTPDGKVAHAAFDLGSSKVFANDEWPGHPVKAPATLGGITSGLYLYVEDCDAWIKKAAAAGAKVSMPAADMFWGDRLGSVTDPFGYSWTIATHVEDVPPAEMEKRQKKWLDDMAKNPRKTAP